MMHGIMNLKKNEEVCYVHWNLCYCLTQSTACKIALCLTECFQRRVSAKIYNFHCLRVYNADL